MKRRWLLSLFMILCLLATWMLPVGAVDSGQKKQTLKGKSLAILGDSYCAGYGLNNLGDAWPYLMAKAWDLTYYDHAISGSTFAAGPSGSAPMVDRVRDLPSDDIDIIIVQGSSNDWNHSIPLGDTDSRDPGTVLGALNCILDTLAEAHPESTVICFTPWVSTGTVNDLGLETSDYGNAMKELCESRNILCYDAADDDANGIHMDEARFREEYCLTSGDRWHMNPKGQALFSPVFAQWLQTALYGELHLSDQFADLIPAGPELRTAVDLMLEKGIMQGTSEVLFSPTRAASRATLAVTLYRMSGSPEVEIQSFSDVASDDDHIAAISWAARSGLLLGEDAFYPNRSLTRQELAQSLMRYGVDIMGIEVTALTGVGQYADREELAAGTEVAFGWCIYNGLIQVSDNQLRPRDIVSRGELAQALAALIRLHAAD